MKIFSGSANLPLAEKIARVLNLTLSSRELFIFPDGERRVWIEDDVLDEDCILVQPTTTSVDEHYMELFFLIDGLKRSGARSVTVVMPYIGYQRQDHIFRSGEAVSLEVVIKLLESLNIDRIVFVDPHTIKIAEMFTIPVSDLSALPLFAEEIKRNNWVEDETVLVTPDMGGIRRIQILSNLLDEMPYVSVVKNRDLETGSLEVSQFEGTVKKRCLIIDDMASSGKTLVEAAELMKKNGAEEVSAFVTHPVFSEEAPELLQNSILEKIYVTDSVLVPQEKQFEKLQILSLAHMIAEEVKHPTYNPIL
jgi:ribose-phosphate pyrophosphokinase